MTDKVQKIREEVARLKLCTMDEHMKFYSECAEAEYYALCKVEEIIDSLQEEPVSDVWHNTNEKPNYVEGDTFANSILVFGKTSAGYGASVCNMIDRDTIYSPMSRKEYKWGECPFTMWAYISDLLHKHEEPVSEELEEAVHEYMQHIPESEPELMDSFYTWEQMEAAFKAGARWQKTKDESTTEDLGEYINELSKQFQEVSFAKLSRIAVRVAKWQKQQMMKEDSQ